MNWIAGALALMLAGCYETASVYDPDQGRYRDRQEVQREQRERERQQDRRLERLEGQRSR